MCIQTCSTSSKDWTGVYFERTNTQGTFSTVQWKTEMA